MTVAFRRFQPALFCAVGFVGGIFLSSLQTSFVRERSWSESVLPNPAWLLTVVEHNESTPCACPDVSSDNNNTAVVVGTNNNNNNSDCSVHQQQPPPCTPPLSVSGVASVPHVDANVSRVFGRVELDSGRPLRVLFLFKYNVFVEQLDRRANDILDAAQRSAYLRATVWGSGWPGWNESTPGKPTVQETERNILDRFGAAAFDVIYCDVGGGFHPVPRLSSNTSRIVSSHFHEIICPQGLGRCSDPLMFPILERVNVAFFAYANAMSMTLQQLTTKNGRYTDRLYYALPHAARADIFCADADAARERPFNVSLVGRISGLYPLRRRLSRLIKEGRLPGGVVKDHPGRSGETGDGERAAYAAMLRQTKVALVTRSVRHYALRKYIEAAMAGTLLIGNIPAERQVEFRSFVVEIDDDEPDESIAAKVDWWLAHDAERIERARFGQQLACRKYTYENFVQQMAEVWTMYLGGMRGAHFPYQFSQLGTFTYYPHGEPPGENVRGTGLVPVRPAAGATSNRSASAA